MCFCSDGAGAPGTADTSPASEEQGKKQEGEARECKLSSIRGQSSHAGTRRSRGRERSQGGAHGSRNSRQEKAG